MSPPDIRPRSSNHAQRMEQQPPIALSDHAPESFVSEKSVELSEAAEQPPATQSRRKRPIDMAYESMRAYTEPPRSSMFGVSPENIYFLPQPSRLPPPPPLDPSQAPPSPPRKNTLPRAKTQAQQVPPPASQKAQGKAKLNLLNPISLLARRRSSRAVEEAYSQSKSTPRLPDDFDPRIRGKVVHDFSAPRPSRPVSSNEPSMEFDGLQEAKWKRRSPNRRSANDQEDNSPSSTEKEHTPVFKENFDDDVASWSADMDSPAKRKSSAFMYQVSLQASQAPDPSSLPAFARNLPSNLSNDIATMRQISSPPPKPHLEILLESPAADQISAKSSPPTSPPKARSRATSINDTYSQGPGSPQRFKSNASRFSFDLAGLGSAAQEKLLEEKHRQKAERQERAIFPSNENDIEDGDDYDGYDDMDDDGLEEKIPGVNADAEISDLPVLQHGIENFQFISPNKSSFESAVSAASTGLTSPATPKDTQCQSVTSKSSPDMDQEQSEDHQTASEEGVSRSKPNLDVAMDHNLNATILQQEVNTEPSLAGLPLQHDFLDDDMYFDDGIIEDLKDDERQPFDESVFDDDTSRVYGLPLRDLGPLPRPLRQDHSPGNQSLQPDHSVSQSVDRDNYEEIVKPLPESLDENASIDELRDSVAEIQKPLDVPSASHTTALTQDKLGLHNQLAYAANQAALQGRFNRAYSRSSTHDSLDNATSSLGTATQDNHIFSKNDGLLISHDVDENDDANYDDIDMAFTEAEDDDPIIAAANAEDLENDDDGFYGQEFGFFARKPGSSDAEYANGGYFGPRAIESIHRMNSGRDNFLEPSLTPITERSEWSNRNSMVSPAMHGYPLSSQYQSSPQLADLMRVSEGEEMSLEALQRLRHSAWGGSSNSLPSSSNSQTGGSPLNYLPPGMVAPFMQATNSNNSVMSPANLAGSYHSFSSRGQASSNDSNPSPSGESPTITISPSQSDLFAGMQQHPPPPMHPPPPPPADSSPVKRSAVNGKPWAPGHSRTGSGAESVSYREENGRWFCEKTRVIEETGEVEVLGRSVIEGGRI